MNKHEAHLSTTSPCPRWQKPATLPFQGSWQTFCVLLSLLLMQFSIFPSFFPHIPLETVPAWIIFLGVTHTPSSAITWTLLTASFLETHSSSPRGLYFLTLTTLVCVVIALRDHISWKYTFPWSIVILCGYLWFLSAESFTLSALTPSYENLITALTAWTTRLITGLIFGLILARYTISRGGEALEYR
ncbi:MAG: hypothetical protein AB8C84_09695 [Oligoflexales bacterium]